MSRQQLHSIYSMFIHPAARELIAPQHLKNNMAERNNQPSGSDPYQNQSNTAGKTLQANSQAANTSQMQIPARPQAQIPTTFASSQGQPQSASFAPSSPGEIRLNTVIHHGAGARYSDSPHTFYFVVSNEDAENSTSSYPLPTTLS